MSDTSPERIVTSEVIEYRKNLGKLSPEKVAEMLGQPLHKGQKKISKYFEEPLVHTWHNLNLNISRRWGKSFLGKVIATTAMLTPYSQVLLITFSTNLSEQWWKDILKGLLSIPMLKNKVEWDKKAGTITIPELNTVFVCCSHLNADTKAIGRQFSLILHDEKFLIPVQNQQEIADLVTPTQTNYGSNSDGIKFGKQISMSTPRGTATGSTAGLDYLKGLNGVKGYMSFTHTIYDSPFLSAEEIENLRLSTSKDSWEQEYLCQFTRTTKTVFRNFDEKKHVIHKSISELQDISQHCEMIIAIDFGQSDGNGASLVLYDNHSEVYYIIDEHYKKEEVTRDLMKTLIDKAKYWSETLNMEYESFIWFYDPSARIVANESSQYFNLTLNKAKNNRTESIDKMNEWFQGNGDSQIPKLYVLDTCPIHISMFTYAEFKIVSGVISNQFAKDPSERGSHYECVQTATYACYSFFKTQHNHLIIS